MRVLIIEDEYHAVQYLSGLLRRVDPEFEIVATPDSVEESVRWLQNHPPPELIFMDIQLADGLSFEIFKHVRVDAPVIFTTAFDQYTLRAFKLNSIDYLLKPVEEEELRAALAKYERLHRRAEPGWQELIASLNLRQGEAYRRRFLLKTGKGLSYLLVADVAHIYSEDGLTFAVDAAGRRHVLDATLDGLQPELDPARFFRINRAQIIRLEAIDQIHSWFNHRLKIDLKPSHDALESVVSRDRVKAFKAWLDR